MNTIQRLERNQSIDALKFICAVLVVFIHAEFAYKMDIQFIIRCAVPCFFMISGFMLFDGESMDLKRLRNSIVKMIRLIIWAYCVYFLIYEAFALIRGEYYVPSIRSVSEFIIFGKSNFVYHLWYLNAYLYILIISYIVSKFGIWRYLFWITPLLLMLNYAFGEFRVFLNMGSIPTYYTRNFLFMGLPYFAIGVFLKKINVCMACDNECNGFMTKCKSGGVRRWNTIIYVFMLIASASSIIEISYIKEFYGGKMPADNMVGTLFLSVCIFCIFAFTQSKNMTTLSLWGRKYSLSIYILHPLFIVYLFPILLNKCPLKIKELYPFLSPILVLIASIIAAEILSIFLKTIFNDKRRIRATA